MQTLGCFQTTTDKCADCQLFSQKMKLSRLLRTPTGQREAMWVTTKTMQKHWLPAMQMAASSWKNALQVRLIFLIHL
jgi:hypothetical protein